MNDNFDILVQEASNGNIEAMGKLYAKTLKSSYFLAYQLSGNEDSAIEILKKSYARVLCTVSKLKKPEAFEIWMKQNIAAVFKENQKFVFTDAEGGTDENSTEFLPYSVLDNSIDKLKVTVAIKNLKVELKTALILQYNNGMPIPAIAKFFGVSPSTANALLIKAKREIVDACDFDSSADIYNTDLPVLTKLFTSLMEETEVPKESVRDIFLYAIDIYNSFKDNEDNVASDEISSKIDDDTEIDVLDEDSEVDASDSESIETETEPEIKDSFASVFSSSSNNESEENSPVISFKDRITDILEDSGMNPEDLDKNSNDEDEDELRVPDYIPTPAPVRTEDIDFDRFTTKPVEQPKKKSSKFDINVIIKNKKMIVLVAIVLAIILLLTGIVSAIKNDKGTSNNEVSTVEMANVEYKWVEGGFENVEEISYLDENCCVFKSTATGKYGLLDYEGNILLQPNYDEFSRCSNGRDYSERNSYHTLVKIGEEYYQFTVNNGTVVISETPHSAHSIQADSLPTNVKYDERDRYFEGYAAARKDDKWGYISKETGKKVIPYEYEAVNDIQATDADCCDYCRPVSNGLIPVKKSGYIGIINLENELVVPFEYSQILCGSNGVFIARKAGTWGVILTGNAINNFGGINLTVTASPVDVNAENTETVKYRVISDDGANIRSDAGADFNLLGELQTGDEIDVISTKDAENGNPWACIKYKDGYGWVAMNNLKKIK